MPTQSITTLQHRCTRCGHSWQGRLTGKPKRCANKQCGSPYWDMPYTRGKPKPRDTA